MIEERKPVPIEPPWIVFACSCGGKTYELNADGGIECRSCGRIQKNMRWQFINEEIK